MSSILDDLPGADQTVIDYASRHQSGVGGAVRRVIRQADYLEPEQRDALLGAIDEALG